MTQESQERSNKRLSAAVLSARAAQAKANAKLVAERTKVVTSKVSSRNPARGFVDFLREQSVVGLAIGLVLGTQAKQIVDQLMASFITPFIGLVLPGQGTLREQVFHLSFRHKDAVFSWGLFVISLITFVAVAAIVYYVFKGLRLDRLDKQKEL